MKTNHQIALVLPWVGELPWYWKLWQKSAAARAFDVLIIRKSLAEFSELVFQKLILPYSQAPAPFHLKRGYKLCDLRPMYGLLFAEELKGYDYWAFGDCDVLYGRLFDAWLQKALEGDYEVATVQQEFTAGPFTMVKNCAKCNHLFEKADSWRAVLDEPKTMAFDELGERWFRKWRFGGVTYNQLRQGNNSFAAICWHESAAGQLRLLAEQVINEDALKGGKRVTYCENGALMWGREEIPLFHFIAAKERFGFGGNANAVWVSQSWRRWRDVARFGLNWLCGQKAARRRVYEWWLRRRGDKDWWKGPAWNNL